MDLQLNEKRGGDSVVQPEMLQSALFHLCLLS